MSNRISQGQVDFLRQSFTRETEPYVKLIVSIRSREAPTYRVTVSGLELVSDGLSERDRETIAICEGLIEAIRRRVARLIQGYFHERA